MLNIILFRKLQVLIKIKWRHLKNLLKNPKEAADYVKNLQENRRLWEQKVAESFLDCMDGPIEGSLTARIFKVEGVSYPESSPEEVILAIKKLMSEKSKHSKMYMPCFVNEYSGHVLTRFGY